MSENNKKHTVENWGSAGHMGPEAWIPADSSCSLGRWDSLKEKMAQLHNLVQHGDFPYLSASGPWDANVTTRIVCVLCELCGFGVEKLRIAH